MSELERAKIETDKIFANIRADSLTYKSFELIWSIYDLIHQQYSIKKISDRNFIINQSESKLKLKQVVFDIIFCAFSFLSILWVKLNGKKTIAIWTGDIFNIQTEGDWRLGDLYKVLSNESIKTIEFVRHSNKGLKYSFFNFFKRGRPVVYYSSILNLFNIFSKHDLEILFKEPNKIDELVVNYFKNEIPNTTVILFFEKVFKFLNVQTFLCWEFSSRQAPLIYASKSQNIPTIGFMHGASYLNFAVNNFISPFKGKSKIGPDFFGVWSNWWKELYIDEAKIYNEIEVINNYYEVNFMPIVKNKIDSILIISEVLPKYDELLPFYKILFSKYKIALKIRKGVEDKFYKFLIKESLIKEDFVIEDDLIQNVIPKYDLVIGSHSTAVLESVLFNRPFLFVNTKYLGNYFNIDSSEFVDEPKDLLNKINSIRFDKIKGYRIQFFGKKEMKFSNWILNKLKDK
jgi:hypothetical protein